MKIVIVGGVAGGASAAARLRRLDERAEIVLFERGPDVSFANCGLPYYVGGEIADRGKLLVVKPELLRTRFRLDIRPRHDVRSIDRARRSVSVVDLATGRQFDESYDRLILSPGAAPLRPPLPGLDLPGVYTLRNLEDVDRIKARSEGARHAVVIGAGFIGLEMVENLVRRGIGVTLVELQDQVLPPLDKEMTAPITNLLKSKGVDLRLSQAAEAFEPAADGAIGVRLKSGDVVTAQLVVVGVGVRPENGLAVAAGLEVGPRGGIRVNEQMQTSDPNIYAVGDAIEVRDFVTEQPTQIPLAGPANRQGRIAADHICGRPAKYRGTQGTAVVGQFGLTAAATGASEKTLTRLGRPFAKVYLHPAHHAGYYPGAEPMSLKLLFDPEDGRILGAQGVGGAGVDKRIDVVAVSLQARLTVYDLEEVELCYAPQFGSAKDPINMAGFIAANRLRGDHPQIGVDEWLHLATLPEADRPLLFDVRTPTEFAAGAVPGAVNLPVDELRDRLGELPRGRRIVAYCQVGQRGYLAVRILLQNGFDAANLAGGYKSWKLFVPS